MGSTLQLPTLVCIVGAMTEILNSSATTYLVKLDERRRPTLPTALLEEAGISAEVHKLIARVDGPGRVVLEDPSTLLLNLQKSIAESKIELGIHGSLVDQLLDERMNDLSLK